MIELRCILLPLDASNLAVRALHVAMHLASTTSAEIVLLHVRPDAASLNADLAEADLEALESESDNLLNLARPVAERFGVPPSRVRAEVRAGGIARAILETADELSADLIIMATHGRRGLLEHLIGSTTERVLSQATASVLVVKPDGFPYLRD